MATDFYKLADQNKRNSWILIVSFVLFVMALGGLMGYATGQYQGNPQQAQIYALMFMAGAVIFAVIGTAASYFGGSSAILMMSSAKPLEKSDDPQLYNVVEEMAIAAGIPCPKVYLIEDSAPNAFATGRNPEKSVVAITTGLRDKLTRDELQGVIAHEISHIRNFDIRYAMLMATLVGIVVLLCDMFLRSMWWGGGRHRSSRRSNRDNNGGALVIVLMVFALLLAIIAPILAKIIEMSFSRQREYLADASAVELTRNPDGLAGALSKISMDKDVLEAANRATAPMYIVHPIKSFEGRASKVTDSHPPIKDRIERILSLKQA